MKQDSILEGFLPPDSIPTTYIYMYLHTYIHCKPSHCCTKTAKLTKKLNEASEWETKRNKEIANYKERTGKTQKLGQNWVSCFSLVLMFQGFGSIFGVWASKTVRADPHKQSVCMHICKHVPVSASASLLCPFKWPTSIGQSVVDLESRLT